jgi:hypothetical protein
MSTPTSKLAPQFNRAHISERDFVEAADYLNADDPSQTATVRRALLLAAIVAYARPFTKNKDASDDRATPFLQARLSKIFAQAELSLHKRLISLRNEALAHSQFERKAVGRISGSDGGFAAQSRSFDILSEQIDRALFLSLCRKMKRHCVNRLFALNHEVSSLESEP